MCCGPQSESGSLQQQHYNVKLISQLWIERGPESAASTLGMPLAFNKCGNGYQNHCEKLETADAKQSSTALARPADPAWFHRLDTRRFYEKPTVCTYRPGPA